MKIIGVTGSSGSGKTTFTNFWKDKEGVGVIHVDDLVSHVKKKYFGMFLEKGRSRKEEASDEENPTLKLKAKAFFYKNKYLFKMLMGLRSFLIKKEFIELLDQYKREGKSLVVIDDWALGTHKYLEGKISKLYVIKREFVSRRTALKSRDNSDEKELKVIDAPYALNYMKKADVDSITVVENDGSFEDLEKKARGEIEQFIVPTFDERYRVNINERRYTVRRAVENTLNYNKNRKSKEW